MMTPATASNLASALAQSGVGGAIGWSLVIIAILVVAFLALVRLRRWIKDDDDAGAGGGLGFGLADIRRLHREGKMSDEEFERLRAMFVAGAKSMARDMPDPLARPGGQPPPTPRDQRLHPPDRPAGT
jgi:hypothetical protein